MEEQKKQIEEILFKIEKELYLTKKKVEMLKETKKGLEIMLKELNK